VIRAAGRDVHAAPAHALDDRGVGNVDLEHVVDRDTPRSSSPRPADRAREAVEQVALAAVRLREPSRTRPMMMSSDTSAPVSIIFFARMPSGVPAFTAARSMSPVEICGMPKAP
jgi:hypothetical protein